MGHIHLVRIPRSGLWRDVVALLDQNADVETVVAASAQAAERSLLNASSNPVYVEAVRLLLSIPIAARQEDFGDALRRIGLDVRGVPMLIDILTATTFQLDRSLATSSFRSDLGEIAGRALVTTFADRVGDDLPSLFGSAPEDVRQSFRKLSWSNGIAVLSRAFFASLVSASLSYWLDRTMASQIGESRRFANIGQRVEFDRALGLHTVEATRIIQEFSSGWVGKQMHDRGAITTPAAREFGHVCLKKIVEELRVRRGSHD